MKKTLLLSVILVTSSILLLNSCKKKKEVDNETQTVVDNAVCEQQFMAIQPVVNTKGINEAGIKKTAACESWIILGAMGGTNTPNPTLDTLDVNADGAYDNGPVTFQIDYGTVGCAGADGIVKTGKINITTAKRWSQYNNTITVELVGYKYGNISYTGTVTISKPDSVTIITNVINGHCTDGTWNIDYSCSKTMKQIAGYSTKSDLTDDAYSIYGTSNGVNRESRAFSTSISSSTPIVKYANCKWISSGVIEVTPSGLSARSVDFGSGGCDDDATFTVDGQTVSFKLK
jgi:hypothetical protein